MPEISRFYGLIVKMNFMLPGITLYASFLDHGVVTWDNGAIDCAPEFMYSHSYEYDTGVA